jgi:ribosomal-protein-alanine N-acetyltransferase
VAQVDKQVVGYGGLMVHAEEAHITTIAVQPSHQHRGIGARLMLDLVSEARARAARTIALEVRMANWPAQRLYAWFGFRPVGVRKNYYAETGEDALIMWNDDLQGADIEARLLRVRDKLGLFVERSLE